MIWLNFFLLNLLWKSLYLPKNASKETDGRHQSYSHRRHIKIEGEACEYNLLNYPVNFILINL
jgi:hypothetical protein